MDDNKKTALSFLRQCQEHLQNNNPVMAWQTVKKAQEYVEKIGQDDDRKN